MARTTSLAFYLYPLDQAEGELRLYGRNGVVAANIEKTTVDIVPRPT